MYFLPPHCPARLSPKPQIKNPARIGSAIQMHRRTRPPVRLHSIHHRRPHWIRLHISNPHPQVTLRHRARVVAILPKVPTTPQTRIQRLRISSMHPPKQHSQRIFPLRHNLPAPAQPQEPRAKSQEPERSQRSQRAREPGPEGQPASSTSHFPPNHQSAPSPSFHSNKPANSINRNLARQVALAAILLALLAKPSQAKAKSQRSQRDSPHQALRISHQTTSQLRPLRLTR